MEVDITMKREGNTYNRVVDAAGNPSTKKEQRKKEEAGEKLQPSLPRCSKY